MDKHRRLSAIVVWLATSAVSFAFLGGPTCNSGQCKPDVGRWCWNGEELIPNHRPVAGVAFDGTS